MVILQNSQEGSSRDLIREIEDEESNISSVNVSPIISGDLHREFISSDTADELPPVDVNFLSKYRTENQHYPESVIIDVEDNPKMNPSHPNYHKMVEELRGAFEHGKVNSVDFREQQLKNMLQMLDENEEHFISALAADLRKPPLEAVLYEIEFLRNELRNILFHLREWCKPVKPKKDFMNIMDSLKIYREPYGVVLIIGAWNYPLQLTLMPVIGAIAGGNCVIIKPSEVAAASAKIIEDLVPRYLDSDYYKVVCGGVPVVTALLKERFDYIFYTGSTAVGHIIHAAAAKFLTPVTLELGGKSPVYIDDTVDIKKAAERILWGKFINSGQTCIAPDYILCYKSVQDKFLEAARDVLSAFYKRGLNHAEDFPKIVSDIHFQRLSKYLKRGKIIYGGYVDSSVKFISPTIMVDVRADDDIMQEEIFGPILPILNVDDVNDAVDFINNREKPLALYIFSNSKADVDLIIRKTSCGGITVNDTVLHIAVDSLPFGGIGNSGMGSYHGRYSFDTFTHEKGVLERGFNPILDKITALRYPPYTDRKLWLLKMLMRKRNFRCLKYVPHLIVFGLGVAATLGYKALAKISGFNDEDA